MKSWFLGQVLFLSVEELSTAFPQAICTFTISSSWDVQRIPQNIKDQLRPRSLNRLMGK